MENNRMNLGKLLEGIDDAIGAYADNFKSEEDARENVEELLNQYFEDNQ